MDARTPLYRVGPRALRVALFGASALVILAGAALPVGFSPSSVDAFQKAAHAKGGGPGGGGPGGNSGVGGPPDHSNAGGNGNGGGGDLSSTGHGDGDHEKNKLGKFNAGNAAEAAFRNANPDSTVGQIAIYKKMVEDGELDPDGDGVITTFEGAKTFLETFANKLVTEGVVATLNDLLGLAPFEAADPEE